MTILIIMLVIGIILRWEYVSREAGDAFRHRFNNKEQTAPAAEQDETPETDPGT